MRVDLARLVPGAEQALSRRRDARHGRAVQGADGEEGAGEVVKAATEGGLTGAAVLLDEQRVQVHPASAGSGQLDPVGSPIDPHRVAEPGQDRQGGLLARGVEVDIDVSMRPGLAPHESVDAPPALEPEHPAAVSALSTRSAPY